MKNLNAGKETKKAIMVLLMRRRLNFFKQVNCYLVFGQEKLMLVHLGNDKEKQLAKEYESMHVESEYAIDRSCLIKHFREYGKNYYTLHENEMLNEDGRNFSLRHKDIVSMRFKPCKNAYGYRTEGGGSLLIKTAAGKIRFSHGYSDWNQNIVGVLMELYGGRTEYMDGNVTSSKILIDENINGFE